MEKQVANEEPDASAPAIELFAEDSPPGAEMETTPEMETVEAS